MASKNKLSLNFPGLEDYARKLEKYGGKLKEVAEEALKKSAEYVTENLEKDIKTHRRTGKTEKSLIKNAKVEWQGTKASIDVGFDIANGGLASIFLMNGTKPHGPRGTKGGHPGTQQDKKLYNDVYGSKTKKEVQEIQEKVFADVLNKIMEK